jgi:NADH-quinone oxidoreductase subunit J
MSTLLFWILALVAILSALGVLLQIGSTLRAALSLVVSLLALAGLFALLGAHFVGLVQVMLYAGAILVVFLLVILTLGSRAKSMGGDRLVGMKLIGALLIASVALKGAGLMAALRVDAPPLPPGFGTTRSLGGLLYTDYLLVFEAAGVLLLAGVIAALVLTKRRLE